MFIFLILSNKTYIIFMWRYVQNERKILLFNFIYISKVIYHIIL